MKNNIQIKVGDVVTVRDFVHGPIESRVLKFGARDLVLVQHLHTASDIRPDRAYWVVSASIEVQSTVSKGLSGLGRSKRS
jgi:hypothetical protein